MRQVSFFVLAISAALAGSAMAQSAPAAGNTATATPAPAAANTVAKCDNPNALGVARTVEIDTTGGPGFGFEHFRQHDFLRDKEVVLTFDDGPWVSTPAVLKALANECVKATFFMIGKHATYYPEIAKQVYNAGHTIGTHTWSHEALVNKKLNEDQRKEEIEKGISAVKWALGGPDPAPFFRFPELQQNPNAVAYLGQRNIAMFSCDLDSFDFRKTQTPDKVVSTVMGKLDKLGKGIILMHDFQKHTADALPTLLRRLKEGGYKVVQIKAKGTLQSLPEYDEALAKELKVPSVEATRPISSVVQTVSK